MARRDDGSGDDALDLGPIDDGQHPAKRQLEPGQHPWAPTALDQYEGEAE